MKAEIITIGDEILIGQIVDTNSAWIAAALDDAGVRVAAMRSVADDGAAIAEAVSGALDAADLVVVTGGLGPTKDDITKKVLADLFGCAMRYDETSAAMIERLLTARGIAFNELNRSQAVLPACCEALPNRNGTAPGMWFDRGGRVLVSLPGVPFEMKALMTGEVLPRLRERFKTGSIYHRTLITAGIAESLLAERIAAWEDSLPRGMKLAYLPGTSGVRLRLSVYDAGANAAEEVERQFTALKQLIPGHTVGYGDDTVQSEVARMLTARRQTLAVAESCTGGRIAAMLTAMPGASAYFAGGVTAYSVAAKETILGVPAAQIERYGVVSEQVATAMALGVKKLLATDYAVATTGVAGPDGGTEEVPAGTVWIAVAHPGGMLTRRTMQGALREQTIERASATALDMVRKIIEK